MALENVRSTIRFGYCRQKCQCRLSAELVIRLVEKDEAVALLRECVRAHPSRKQSSRRIVRRTNDSNCRILCRCLKRIDIKAEVGCIQRHGRHFGFKNRRQQLVERERRLRNYSFAPLSEDHRQAGHDQFVRAVADKNAVFGPAGEFRQRSVSSNAGTNSG